MIYGIALGFFLCSVAVLSVALRRRTQEARRTRNELEKRAAERTAELTVSNGILVLEVEDRKQVEQDLRESRAI
jgi:C4-dicarboxylate-specific signal transduction histidine kinase